MQLLLLLSAFLSALVGSPGARVVPAQPIAAARSVAAIAPASAATAIPVIVLAVLYALARAVKPGTRPLALSPATPIYGARRRE